jgi:hypothetical protein
MIDSCYWLIASLPKYLIILILQCCMLLVVRSEQIHQISTFWQSTTVIPAL